MDDPDALGEIAANESRIYAAPDGEIQLSPRGRDPARLTIATVGRDASWCSSPALEAWVRRVATDPGIREVWTGHWDLEDDAALSRVRRTIVSAGAQGVRQSFSDPTPQQLTSGWRQYLAHPQPYRYAVSWTALVFDACMSHAPPLVDVVGRTSPQWGPLKAWEAWVAGLPQGVRRDRVAPDRETEVRLSLRDPALARALDVMLAAADAPPDSLSVQYRERPRSRI